MTPAALRLRVPATTANLGSGYDLIGAALNLSNHFCFEPAAGLSLQLEGPRAQECHFELTQDSLVWQAFARVYQQAGQKAPFFKLTQEVQVPPARGLGSSSTAIIAGLLAANHWLDQPLGQEELLQLATELEGHPDNVAAALLGGCIFNHPDGSWTRVAVPDSLQWVVCIPDFELPTTQARSVVPQQLQQRAAIDNMAYFGSLLLGLSLNQPELIAKGLNDQLHQPYRQALVPGMTEVIAAARSAGALGAVLSGAGPTLLALSLQAPATIGAKMVHTWAEFGIQASFVTCIIDQQGAVCLD